MKSSQLWLGRFFVLAISLILGACTNDLSEVKDTISNNENEFNETGKNVRIVFSENAQPSIIIEAEEAIRHSVDDPYTEFTKGMKLSVYNDEGEIESTLTANYGRMNDGSTQMIAKDDVVVINESGEQLNTEDLIWDQEEAIIRSDGFVKISTPTEIIYGNGFISNDNFTDYTIFRITGTVQVDGDIQ